MISGIRTQEQGLLWMGFSNTPDRTYSVRGRVQLSSRNFLTQHSSAERLVDIRLKSLCRRNLTLPANGRKLAYRMVCQCRERRPSLLRSLPSQCRMAPTDRNQPSNFTEFTNIEDAPGNVSPPPFPRISDPGMPGPPDKGEPPDNLCSQRAEARLTSLV